MYYERSQMPEKRSQSFAGMNLPGVVWGIAFQGARFLVGLLLGNQLFQHFIPVAFPCHGFTFSGKAYGFRR